MAARISVMAVERGVPAVPAHARSYEIGVDAPDPAALAKSWAAALGYRVGPQEDEVTDPFGRGPTVWFQRADTPSTSRLHLDVHVADELQDVTIAAVSASGGRTLVPSRPPPSSSSLTPTATGSASPPRTDRRVPAAAESATGSGLRAIGTDSPRHLLAGAVPRWAGHAPRTCHQ